MRLVVPAAILIALCACVSKKQYLREQERADESAAALAQEREARQNGADELERVTRERDEARRDANAARAESDALRPERDTARMEADAAGVARDEARKSLELAIGKVHAGERELAEARRH